MSNPPAGGSLPRLLMRLKNHWIITLLALSGALIIWLANVTQAFSQLAGLFGFSTPKPALRPEVTLTDAELDRLSIPRFGFSFVYPKAWSRFDPDNGDGHTFTDPNATDVKMLAWGGYALEEKTVEDVAHSYRPEVLKLADPHILQDLPAGLFLWKLSKEPGGQVETREEEPGWRLKYEYLDHDLKKKITVLDHLTLVDKRVIGVEFRAPSDLYPAYSKLFDHLFAELHVLVAP